MGAALEFGFFLVSGIRVGEEVVGVAGAHDAGAGEGEGHPGGVDGDPAAAPLFGDVGGGARAAGGVQHQVAGVGGHEDAALDDFGCRLNDIGLWIAKTTGNRIGP